MSNFPVSFAADASPLPLARLGEAGQESAAALAAKGFEVLYGLTPEYLTQVAAMAREPGMLEFTPRDSAERFTDEAAAARWQSKGRLMFLLIHRQGDGSTRLAGYGWAGPGSCAQVPAGETTFAIRIGEMFQGQGLAAPFAWLIIAGSAVMCDAWNFWLETWQSNGAAVHIYHKLGFQDVGAETASRTAGKESSVQDTRLFMELPNENLPSSA